MNAGWNYVMDANRYLGYAKSIQSNQVTEQSSRHKQNNPPASDGTELDTVLVMGKRPPYQERKDIRFFEYENLRDIADFAADDEQRQAIDEYLGSKNYQYTNQPWYAKPYMRSPGRNLSNIHIGKPMEDTASSINLSNPFSEYYRIVFNEQQRNFIEQTGKSAGTAVLKTLLEPALEVSDLTNAGRNMILGGNEYPTNMSALGDYVQQGAGTGKALLFVGQNVALTAVGARFPKISIGAGTLYGSHTTVSGILENNPEKTGEGIAVLGGSTLGGYTYGLGRRFKIERGDHQPNITSSSAAGQGKSVHTAPATPTQPNRQAQTGVAQGTSQPTTQVKPTAGSGSGAAAGRNTATRAKNSIFDSYPQATTLNLGHKTLLERAQFLSQHIPGLPVAQAKVILEMGARRNTSIVIGGSRVRGNATPKSDIDIGFGHLNPNQAGKALDRIKRDSAKIPDALKVEDTVIAPGNETKNIPRISSPEEFFQRSGNRAGRDGRAGQPFHPSGSVTIHPNGIIQINPPRK